jgi:hypothetical protein
MWNGLEGLIIICYSADRIRLSISRDIETIFQTLVTGYAKPNMAEAVNK